MVSCPGDNQISLTGHCQIALGRSALELYHVVLALVLRTTDILAVAANQQLKRGEAQWDETKGSAIIVAQHGQADAYLRYASWQVQ